MAGSPSVDRGPDGLEGAVGRDELGRGLLADARHAGQSVARVAPQDRHVGVGGPGGDAVLLRQERLVDEVGGAHAAAGGVDDAHVVRVVDELEEVAVAGDDVDRHPAAERGGQRADDVVGLVAVDADPGDAERRQRVDDDRHLDAEGLRNRSRRRARRARARRRGGPCRTGWPRPGTPGASRCPSRRRGASGDRARRARRSCRAVRGPRWSARRSARSPRARRRRRGSRATRSRAGASWGLGTAYARGYRPGAERRGDDGAVTSTHGANASHPTPAVLAGLSSLSWHARRATARPPRARPPPPRRRRPHLPRRSPRRLTSATADRRLG